MEVFMSYTGVWKSMFGNMIKETISIIRCDELYIGMRVCEIMGKDEFIPIETRQSKDYAGVFKFYEEWNKALMSRMLNKRTTGFILNKEENING